MTTTVPAALDAERAKRAELLQRDRRQAWFELAQVLEGGVVGNTFALVARAEAALEKALEAKGRSPSSSCNGSGRPTTSPASRRSRQ